MTKRHVHHLSDTPTFPVRQVGVRSISCQESRPVFRSHGRSSDVMYESAEHRKRRPHTAQWRQC